MGACFLHKFFPLVRCFYVNLVRWVVPLTLSFFLMKVSVTLSYMQITLYKLSRLYLWFRNTHTHTPQKLIEKESMNFKESKKGYIGGFGGKKGGKWHISKTKEIIFWKEMWDALWSNFPQVNQLDWNNFKFSEQVPKQSWLHLGRELPCLSTASNLWNSYSDWAISPTKSPIFTQLTLHLKFS